MEIPKPEKDSQIERLEELHGELTDLERRKYELEKKITTFTDDGSNGQSLHGFYNDLEWVKVEIGSIEGEIAKLEEQRMGIVEGPRPSEDWLERARNIDPQISDMVEKAFGDF